MRAALLAAEPAVPPAAHAAAHEVVDARTGEMTLRVAAASSVSLPVPRGGVAGRVVVTDGSRLVGTRLLVASRSSARPGGAARVGWYAGRALHHVLGWVP